MIIQDFKYALRLLSKRPGFTALTTLVMATGIGLSLFLFSFLNTMAFKDLPLKDGGSLVMISSYQQGVVDYGREINLHDYQQIRDNLKGIAEFGAYRTINVNVSGRDGAKRYSAIATEPNMFDITRTQPLLGRTFTPAENHPGSEYVVVLGYDLWQNQYGGDEQVLKQSLRINGQSHRIIGVMPQGYYFPARAEMWLPMREDATKIARGNSGSYYGLGHLQPGVSMDEIDNQLETIMLRIEQKYPKTNSGLRAYVSTIQNSQGNRNESDIIYSMYIVAILILVLAGVNVGNLLLSRAVERSKETAIRVALGAPRSRLISQMLWESIIICSLGGLIGLLMVAWGLEVMASIVATFTFDKPVFWWKFGIDAFTIKLFVSFIIGSVVITGLIPAWRNSGGDFNSVLRDGTRGALGKKAGRMNRLLVMAEIFISMIVLIVAGIMLTASYKATHADSGADTTDVLAARIMLTESDYDSPQKQLLFAKTLQSHLETSTDIQDVMVSSALPGFWSETAPLMLEGKEYLEENDNNYPRANYIVVSPGSLAKLGIALKQGRYFNSGDEGLAKSTVIVTESFVSRHFPDQSALGKRVKLMEMDGENPKWLTIIGVVEHTTQGPANEPRGKYASIFRPYSQAPRQQINIAMHMKADIKAVTRTLRKTLQSIDPELPAFRIEAYADTMARIVAPLQFISTVFLLFGIAALVLAASGIYGVMANTISQRTQEIGIKQALGADEQEVTREFLITGAKQLLAGGLPGFIAGCAIGFAMSQLMGVSNTGLVIIGFSMMFIIGIVVMLATYLPTKRALEMEPAQALHYE